MKRHYIYLFSFFLISSTHLVAMQKEKPPQELIFDLQVLLEKNICLNLSNERWSDIFSHTEKLKMAVNSGRIKDSDVCQAVLQGISDIYQAQKASQAGQREKMISSFFCSLDSFEKIDDQLHVKVSEKECQEERLNIMCKKR